MSNPWFRMYSEFSHDPKVQMLSEAMQRRYIMLMCLRCSDTLVTLHDEEVAFHLRISNDELSETKALFVAKGFIDLQWTLLNWEKRQFASDTSKARVAKHRALLKDKQKADGNTDVTLQVETSNALDTDTDTDTDKKREDKKPAAQAFVLPDWIPKDTWAAYCKVRSGKKAKNEPHALGLIVKDLEQFKLAGHNPVEVLNNSIKSGWSGVFEPKNKPFNQAAGVVITVPSRAGIDPELLRRDEASKQARAPSLDILARLAKIKLDARAEVSA